jgi:transcriptional regulator with XRE-family HTH domain
MNDARDLFIHNLRLIRAKKGLSQQKLAETANLSSGMIGDIETGRRNPTLETIDKISNALGVPVQHLFFDPDDISKTEISEREQFRERLYSLLDEYWDR